MSIPAEGGQGNIPIQIPGFIPEVAAEVVGDKARVIPGDVLASAGTEEAQPTWASSSALASTPSPPAGKNLSITDLASNPSVTGPTGRGNPWLSETFQVALAEIMGVIAKSMREIEKLEGKLKVGNMAESVEMGLTASALIKLSASKEAGMHIASAVMGGVSIGSAGFKLGAMSKGFRKSMGDNKGPIGDKFKMWNKQADSAEKAFNDAKLEEPKLLKDFETKQNKVDNFSITDPKDSKNTFTHKELKTKIDGDEKNKIVGDKDKLAELEKSNNPSNPNNGLYDKFKEQKNTEMKVRDDLQKQAGDLKNEVENLKKDPNPEVNKDKIVEKTKLLDEKNKAIEDQRTKIAELDGKIDALGSPFKERKDLANNEELLKIVEEGKDFKEVAKGRDEAKQKVEENNKIMSDATTAITNIDNQINTVVQGIAGVLEGAGHIGEGIAKGVLTLQKGEADALKATIDALREVVRQQMDSSSQAQRGAHDDAKSLWQAYNQMVDSNSNAFNLRG